MFSALLVCLALDGQTSVTHPVFEVASVHLHRQEALDQIPITGAAAEAMRVRGGPGTNTPTRIQYRGVTLKMLLSRAWGVGLNQITGPSWLSSDQYDIVANVPPSSTKEDLAWMLQDLLVSRFRLESHIDQKILPVYSLTIAPSGPRLTPSRGEIKLSPEEFKAQSEELRRKQQESALKTLAIMRAGKIPRSRRSFGLPNATLEEFAKKLSSELNLPVQDETGLGGRWQFNLQWVLDSTPGSQALPDDDTSPGDPIFVAIEKQLGLRLRPHKQTIEVLVVDQAVRVPVEN